MKAALICPVPDAVAAVESHRERLDPSRVLGVPPHVTVLVPFAPPLELGDGELAALARDEGPRLVAEAVMASAGARAIPRVTRRPTVADVGGRP